MQRETGPGQLNQDQIEQHLRSAVDALTPNVLSGIDFTVRQDAVPRESADTHAAVLKLQRRLRGYVLAAAACFCVLLMGGGVYGYHIQNQIVESVIGIDVNPSIEISINKKQKVLSVRALNTDGQEILADMDLTGTDLNVAVNAVVGSMVTHGYLDDLDNAILVTVSNDSVRKAKELRAAVVSDIEQTLEENQVQAVVYDQQVIEDEEMFKLAEQYGISYGKAYFLKELIDQNPELTMDDMERLSAMTMEELAAAITEDSYVLGELADRATETKAPETEPETTEPETTEPETPDEETSQPETAAEETAPETETAAAAPTTEEETEEIQEGRVKIDYADYEDGTVYVCFVTRVNWKNPTVSVRDDEGNSYSAMVDETSSDECTIEVSGLEGGRSYTFVLGGLTPKEGGGATTVKGYFDVPEIAKAATDWDEDDEDREDDEEEDADEAGSSAAAGEQGTLPDSGSSSNSGNGADRTDRTDSTDSAVSDISSEAAGSGGVSSEYSSSGEATAGGTSSGESGLEDARVDDRQDRSADAADTADSGGSHEREQAPDQPEENF